MKTILTILITSLFFISIKAQSPGDLLITPYRVVFEGGKNIEELTVANTGTDTARYSIGFLQYKMMEDGVLKLIEEPEGGVLFADRYLRFFPRAITLAPNEAQVVRVQVRTPANLEPAEYRSHLYFRSIVDEQPDMGEQSDTLLRIQLIPVYGISIPLILRVGELNVQANISDIVYNENIGSDANIEFNLLREGTMSTFGIVEITHTSEEGQKTLIGRANGVAVYTPLSSRKVRIPLNIPEQVDIKKGSLQIKYFVRDMGRESVYFEHSFSIK